jgi:hypothetical protein
VEETGIRSLEGCHEIDTLCQGCQIELW